ncbi:MAG: hypothetical protein JW908_12455 [Anaerolineales bacterium]|nr:hypothetical protein [Anaerolineales bacterium]
MTKLLDLPHIIKALNLDVPIYRVKMHDDCVELHLYGGKVVTWNPKNDGDLLPGISDQGTTVQHSHKKIQQNRETKKRRKSI